MGWLILAVKNSLDFDGRSRRKGYWFFVLFYDIFLLAVVIVDVVSGFGFIVVGFYSLAMLITQFSLAIRNRNYCR